ncbi:MAG TPA: hypothetical protein VGR98_12975 [Streptosporangiaceae bacterium]|nr:hypothetical protein [Streptosporangiaceae bacterium]
MSPPVRTEPPYVPIRRGRWPVGRTPRWLLLAVAALVVAAVLVGLAHRPSPSQRAADLRAFLADMRTDIQSCAGGVGESLTALRGLGPLPSPKTSEVKDTISIAAYGASNCSPANSMPLDDLDQYQVTESLASFHLSRVVTGLVNWAAPDAIDVQTDVVAVLRARDARARSSAMAALQRAISRLDAQRAAVDSIIENASRSLSANAAPPALPG